MRVVAWLLPFGCLLLAPAAWAQSNTTTTTTSTAEVDTVNTTNVAQQVNTFQVELKARMQGGAVVFDQTFNVAYSDLTVQAAVTQARNLLTTAGALYFTGPTQLSNTQSLVSSVTGTVQTGTQVTQVLVGTQMFIGPVTLSVGNRGICQSYILNPPGNYATLSGCSGGQSFPVAPGGVDFDTLTTSLVTINQTATTTNTFLTSQVYELDGSAAPFLAVPTLSQWGMLLLAGLLAGAAVLELRRRTRRRVVACAPRQ